MESIKKLIWLKRGDEEEKDGRMIFVFMMIGKASSQSNPTNVLVNVYTAHSVINKCP